MLGQFTGGLVETLSAYRQPLCHVRRAFHRPLEAEAASRVTWRRPPWGAEEQQPSDIPAVSARSAVLPVHLPCNEHKPGVQSSIEVVVDG